MYQMILSLDVPPNLSWKVTVGWNTPCFALGDCLKYFNFVNNVTKLGACRPTLLIHTKYHKVAVKKKAEASAAKKLIASANGPLEVEVELAQANELLQAIVSVINTFIQWKVVRIGIWAHQLVKTKIMLSWSPGNNDDTTM
ncbi:hypothetical protein DFH28DRAFT_923443 [Melampsora americana]|nr:hypothetical protein DFH28DRAFT_923443 [Melampsora americana]